MARAAREMLFFDRARHPMSRYQDVNGSSLHKEHQNRAAEERHHGEFALTLKATLVVGKKGQVQ